MRTNEGVRLPLAVLCTLDRWLTLADASEACSPHRSSKRAESARLHNIGDRAVNSLATDSEFSQHPRRPEHAVRHHDFEAKRSQFYFLAEDGETVAREENDGRSAWRPETRYR
jgi:hypothetical protein